MSKIDKNLGFDDRVFLTEIEWVTYRRRSPVRFINKIKTNLCIVCDQPATASNPMQNSHKIGFNMGVIYLGLTPDFVDGHDNIVSAHRDKCNSEVELSLESACLNLKSVGITELPTYLPKFIHEIWSDV